MVPREISGKKSTSIRKKLTSTIKNGRIYSKNAATRQSLFTETQTASTIKSIAETKSQINKYKKSIVFSNPISLIALFAQIMDSLLLTSEIVRTVMS